MCLYPDKSNHRSAIKSRNASLLAPGLFFGLVVVFEFDRRAYEPAVLILSAEKASADGTIWLGDLAVQSVPQASMTGDFFFFVGQFGWSEAALVLAEMINVFALQILDDPRGD